MDKLEIITIHVHTRSIHTRKTHVQKRSRIQCITNKDSYLQLQRDDVLMRAARNKSERYKVRV